MVLQNLMLVSNQQLKKMEQAKRLQLAKKLFLKYETIDFPFKPSQESLLPYIEKRIKEASNFGFTLEYDFESYLQICFRHEIMNQKELPDFVKHELTWPNRKEADSLDALLEAIQKYEK